MRTIVGYPNIPSGYPAYVPGISFCCEGLDWIICVTFSETRFFYAGYVVVAEWSRAWDLARLQYSILYWMLFVLSDGRSAPHFLKIVAICAIFCKKRLPCFTPGDYLSPESCILVKLQSGKIKIPFYNDYLWILKFLFWIHSVHWTYIIFRHYHVLNWHILVFDNNKN